MPFGPGTYGPNFPNFPGPAGPFVPQIPTRQQSPMDNTGPIGQMPPGMPQNPNQMMKQRETPEQQKRRNKMREGMGGGIPLGGYNPNQGGMGRQKDGAGRGHLANRHRRARTGVPIHGSGAGF